MKLYSIETGLFKLDGGAMFGVVPKSIWNKLNPADDNNMCEWALRCLLLVEGDKRILIDTGMGNKQDERFFSHYYLSGDDSLESSLGILGFTPADITDVILTHLHFDHCGGAIVREEDELVPAFPNAHYWSNEAHWQWATQPNAREKASFLKDNILPIASSGKLQMVDSSNIDLVDGRLASCASHILPELSFRFANGHTRGMMLPQIQYNGYTIVYMADLLPSTGHIPLPYVMAYDMFPLLTLDEKSAFLNEAVDNQYILFFEHDPINECCTLVRTDKGIRVKETFKLSEL